MNMHSQYPEIITEIIERVQRDELRHFDLSSFMSDINLHDVYPRIDRTMNFFYDNQNNFIFQRKEESLWLNFMDLTGNFKIDLDESREILKDVNEIERKS